MKNAKAEFLTGEEHFTEQITKWRKALLIADEEIFSCVEMPRRTKQTKLVAVRAYSSISLKIGDKVESDRAARDGRSLPLTLFT